MTTFNLAHQTSRWSRFAEVTVEIEPAAADTVTVAAGTDDDSMREAACGAWEALRLTPAAGGRRVTVTRIHTAPADTGPGDVYEAAVRAVWLASPVPAPPYTGCSQPDVVQRWLRNRIGQQLTGVTAAHQWVGGVPVDGLGGLIHVWLHFEHGPPGWLHGHGDELLLSCGDPYAGYPMAAAGEVRVGPAVAPGLLVGMGGRRLLDASVVVNTQDRAVCAGLVLRLDGLDVVAGVWCDEWVVESAVPVWADGWRQWGWLASR